MNSLLLISIVGIVSATSDELLSVNVVIRHADRAASSGWATPESPTILFRGNGELTDDGIDNAFAQGKDFKERYVKTGFIDKRFLPTEVFVRASEVNRCLMSAASFTNALFKDTSKDHAVIPPIYTKEQANDPLLVPLLSCQDGWDDVIARFNLSSNVNVMQTSVVAMMQTMWPAACSTVNPALFDAIIAELPNKLINMPANYKSCAQGVHYLELLAGAGNSFNELRLKRVAGLLTNELLNNFAAVANCASVPCPGQPKMRIYYTIYQKNGQKANFVDTNNCASGCSLSAITAAAAPRNHCSDSVRLNRSLIILVSDKHVELHIYIAFMHIGYETGAKS
ncbi:hypothetical protein PRIPAC_78315 [Pristionchus pacificus]|nr:hypothetical protein PRIPAC_78315 [Pristionchus pacificus]